jgi:hypothetical protein
MRNRQPMLASPAVAAAAPFLAEFPVCAEVPMVEKRCTT